MLRSLARIVSQPVRGVLRRSPALCVTGGAASLLFSRGSSPSLCSGQPWSQARRASSSQPAAYSEKDIVTTYTGLQYVEVEIGTGESPKRGDNVKVHYTGTLEDGTVFDSSVTRGVPIEFPLGRGSVIKVRCLCNAWYARNL